MFPVAASYSAKGSRYDPVSMTFNFNPYNRVKLEVKNENEEGVARFEGEPRENTRPNTGQDAFFISRIGGDGGVAVGVVCFIFHYCVARRVVRRWLANLPNPNPHGRQMV